MWYGSGPARASFLLGVFPQRPEISLQQTVRKEERPPGSKTKSKPQGAIGKRIGSLPTFVFSVGRMAGMGCSVANSKDGPLKGWSWVKG